MTVFRIDAPAAKQILSRFPCVVRRGLSLQEARHFELALRTIGARVVVQEEQTSDAPSPPPRRTGDQPVATSSAPRHEDAAADRAGAPASQKSGDMLQHGGQRRHPKATAVLGQFELPQKAEAARTRSPSGESKTSAAVVSPPIRAMGSDTIPDGSPAEGSAQASVGDTRATAETERPPPPPEQAPLSFEAPGAEPVLFAVPSALRNATADNAPLPHIASSFERDTPEQERMFGAPPPPEIESPPQVGFSNQELVEPPGLMGWGELPLDLAPPTAHAQPDPQQPRVDVALRDAMAAASDYLFEDIAAPVNLPALDDPGGSRTGLPSTAALQTQNFNLELSLDVETLRMLGRSAESSGQAVTADLEFDPRVTPATVTSQPPAPPGAQKWLQQPFVKPPVPNNEVPEELQLHAPPYALLACLAAPAVALLVRVASSSWLLAGLTAICVGFWIGFALPCLKFAHGLTWLSRQTMYFSRTEADSPFDLEFVRTYERWAKYHGFELERILDVARTESVRTIAVFRHVELPTFLLLRIGGPRIECDFWSLFERGISLTTTDRARELPPPAKQYLQNLPGAGLRLLWQRHAQGHDAFTERVAAGAETPLDFEANFRRLVQAQLQLVEPISLWPLRVPLWRHALRKHNGQIVDPPTSGSAQ